MTDSQPDDARVNLGKPTGPAVPPAAAPPADAPPVPPTAPGPVPPPGYGPPPGAFPPPGHPQAQSAAGPAVLVSIGDIICTQTEVITPSGTIPIAGSQWWVSDMSSTTEAISTTGIVLTVVLFFFICLFSLLFLLLKETKTSGYLQVTVSGNGVTHVTTIPALTSFTAADIHGRVAYARNLAAQS